MHLRFLGDAFDHWKGSLFGELLRTHLLRDLAVDAMAADAADWLIADFRLYAHLLRVRPGQVIMHNSSLMHDRSRYFSEIGHCGDLFLDPNTGIATGRYTPRWNYVFPAELHALLAPQQRVIAVYQHISRQKARQRVKTVVGVLSRHGSRLVCCSYETPSATMLFFSRNRARVLAIQDCFEKLLGRHSHQRISFWESPSNP